MGCKPLDKLKKKHKKGLWSPDEDQKLRDYILNYGHGCWSSVPINAGLQRTGKSCRLRWINYLRPGLKRGAFSFEEEEIILSLHQILGNKWSQIAHHLPGRTDNEIKNHWHSYLKKRVSKAVETEAHGNNGSMNGQIQGSDLLQIPRNCSSESFDNMEVSLVNVGESVPPQIETSGGAPKSSLPKILFAEWLCLDQFHASNLSSGSASDFKYSLEDNISNSKDSLSHGLMFNEGAFAGEGHPKFNSIPEDHMIESSFKFADQVAESCLNDYFPGEFNMNFDYMYYEGCYSSNFTEQILSLP